MGRTWILHTETKGTGAQMVPLETAAKRSAPVEPVLVRRQTRKPAPEPEPRQPKAPRRFKIVDVMTRCALVEDVGARQALAALSGVRSMVDVNVYLWDETGERWRLVTLAEQRTLWELSRQPAESLDRATAPVG